MKNILVLVVSFLLIIITNCIPSNSFYLINIDNNKSPSSLSNESYCSNILINQELYRIPEQCQHHLLCNSYYCDDRSFRCIKIRDALCCLYRYFQLNCPKKTAIQIKGLFRSVYFQMSVEHGQCEINPERIEQNDQTYCISHIEHETSSTTEVIRTTVISSSLSLLSSRSSIKYVHRRPSTLVPHRIATRQNFSSLKNVDYSHLVTIIEQPMSSTCSTICFLDRVILMIIVLVLSIIII